MRARSGPESPGGRPTGIILIITGSRLAVKLHSEIVVLGRKFQMAMDDFQIERF